MAARTIPARPTTYNGIKMRSRLEAKFAERLDRAGLPWVYEPQCFAGPEGQYLPDFALDGADEAETKYVEVKPLALVADPWDLFEQMAVIWRSERSACLMLALHSDELDQWEYHYLNGTGYAYDGSGTAVVYAWQFHRLMATYGFLAGLADA